MEGDDEKGESEEEEHDEGNHFMMEISYWI